MLLSPLTSTAPGNFIQDRVASAERPKPPLVSLQKVEGALEREMSHPWAGEHRPASPTLWAGRTIMKSAGPVGEIPEQNEKQSVRYEEARERGPASPICLLSYFDGSREIAYSGIYK